MVMTLTSSALKRVKGTTFASDEQLVDPIVLLKQMEIARECDMVQGGGSQGC
jgi:hypothetical protein